MAAIGALADALYTLTLFRTHCLGWTCTIQTGFTFFISVYCQYVGFGLKLQWSFLSVQIYITKTTNTLQYLTHFHILNLSNLNF